jgi:D-xylose transport system permease protein
MTQPTHSPTPATSQTESAFSRFLKATEIDTRLFGMVGALLLIWLAFEAYAVIMLGKSSLLLGGNGAGTFLTPRNLWNLSVQTASIGIMATGMVLVIITRNIDLSVGSMLGLCGVVMGLMQVYILPPQLGLGHPMIWIIAVLAGISTGIVVGAFHGWLIAYRRIPSFIVTLGGLMVWRGTAYLVGHGGETISPVDTTFVLLGGGPYGSVGGMGSWIVGMIAAAAIVFMVVSGRKQRRTHGFAQRPVWADTFLGALGCGFVLGAVLLVNAYPWPAGIVKDWAAKNAVTVPETGLFISHGFAIPVLILIVVGIVMTILMTRSRFGRYVFAIGGNPEAAELAGINTRLMSVKIFALMGGLAGLSAVVASARLNSASSTLGVLDELYVIAAAVIGGTSLAGGVGTIYGAILGALVMQSLQSGMVLIGFDAAIQQIVVGLVLVLAVYLDIVFRSKSK